MLSEFRRIFLVGIFASAPLILTLYLILKLFQWFDALFQPLIQPLLTPYIGFALPGLGILVGIIIIFAMGLLAPSLIGKQFILFTENVVERVPLVKVIYSGTKQVFSSFSQSSMSKFNRVVMVPFPHQGVYSIGFVTQENKTSWVPNREGYTLAVFVPTTPNPTSGYLMFFEEKDAISLNISVEDALKLIISVGLVNPAEKMLLEKS